jgi:predicted GIY-YIG superfamily endonuclease
VTAQPETEIGDELPTALYRLYAADGSLLYVGVTGDLRVRLAKHAADKPWWTEVARKTAAWHDSRKEALLAEAAAIRDESPRYNVTEPRTREEVAASLRGPSSDRHKYTPISIRPPADSRAWLMAHAENTGQSVRSILLRALAEYRERAEGASA